VNKAAGSYYNFMQKYVAYVDLVNAPQDNNINSLAGLLGVATHRAVGGPVVGGKPYLVGEKGPELIFPTQAGYVATANQTAAMAKNATSQGQYASASADQSDIIAAGLQALVTMFNNGLSVSFDSQSLQTGLIVANKDRGRR
jgi:phage-related minor tail protein